MAQDMNGTSGICEGNAACILLAGSGGAFLVSAFLALTGLVFSAGGSPDLVPGFRSVLSTFAWMSLYYLAAAFPLGLLAAAGARLFLRQKSPAHLLPIVVMLLLAAAAIVNAAVSTESAVAPPALSLLGNSLLGITAAVGTGATINWLRNRRIGSQLLIAAMIMTPIAVLLFALHAELRNHISAYGTRKFAGGILLLAVGGIIALLLTAAYSRMSRPGRRFCAALFALVCASLVFVPLMFGDRPDAYAMGGGDGNQASPAGMATFDPSSSPPNVILISIDTLRADGLSCYGNPDRTSPAIDRVASQGIRFQQAYSPSSWTLPSHASMFTGLYTASHGADKSLDQSGGAVADPLPPGIPTLAETLRQREYRTAGFISNPWVGSVFGLGRGFDEYDDRTNKAGVFLNVKDSLVCRALLAVGIWDEQDFNGSRKVDDFLPAALEWIRRHSQDRFFLFLHFFEPHYVYEPPQKYRLNSSGKPIPVFRDIESLISGKFSLPPARRAELKALYEGEIKYLDEKLSELFDLLDSTGLTGRTLLIITSDHGESLGEHGLWTHGNSLYDDQLHIPLIMRLPGLIPEGRVIGNQLASLVDLMPSILDIVGVPPVQGMQGRSLRAAWEGGGNEAQRTVYAELRPAAAWRSINPNLGFGMRMIHTLDAKYIEGYEGQRELYLTAEDPREEHNVLEGQPDLVHNLSIALHSWQSSTLPAGRSGDMKLNPETIRQLRALGYIR